MKRVRVEVEFAIVPIWLLTADVSAQAVRIYAVLARLGYKGQVPHPSHKELAETARCSSATVRRALDELAALGAIEVKERIDGRGRDSNGYLVKVNRPLLMGEQAGLFTDEQAPRSPVSRPKEEEKDLEEIAPDRRDLLFEAVMEVCGIALDDIPQEARGKYGAVVKALRKMDVTPQDVRLRAARAWFKLTPTGLLRHWAELAPPRRAVDPSPRSRRLDQMSDEELEALRVG